MAGPSGFSGFVSAEALFYPAALSKVELLSLATRRNLEPVVDVIEFADEAGGEIVRELAVPFIAGMDEVQVDEAQLRIRADPKRLDISAYEVQASSSPADDVGVIVALPKPARLLAVELVTTFPSSTAADVAHAHFRAVVRPATRTDTGFEFGPPIFAARDFPAPGPMFGRVLSGMGMRDLGGGRREITFGGVLGEAWLFQFAVGSEPTELRVVPYTASVARVTVDAAVRDLAITLASDAEPIQLWSHPDLLLPDVGVQDVSFTPAAQTHLDARLAAAAAEVPPPVTLAVPLTFSSTSGGGVGVVTRTLNARYVVRPLGAEPTTLRLGGAPTPLPLRAPAARRPGQSGGRLVAKHLGRELNDGSPEPPAERPGGGLRVDVERWVAARVAFEPLAGGSAGDVLSLASARAFVDTAGASELVLEIRSEVAGLPGPTVSTTVVRQLEAGFAGWLEFEPPAPVPAVAGAAPLWVCLRATRGEAHWFGDGIAGDVRLSTDRAATWSPVDPLLRPAGGLLVQLFHAVTNPSTPRVRLVAGATTLAADLLAGATATGEAEFAVDALSLPGGVADRLAASHGEGTVVTELALTSRAVVDLTFDGLTLLYSPIGT